MNDVTGTDHLIDAAEVRAHIGTLTAAGIGLRRMSELTGLDRVTLHRLRAGTHRKVRVSTADAVLAVTVDQMAAGARVDAAAAHKHVEELCALGWSRREIAEAIGMGSRLRIGQDRVTVATADAIEALWRARTTQVTPTTTVGADRDRPHPARHHRRSDWIDTLDEVASAVAAGIDIDVSSAPCTTLPTTWWFPDDGSGPDERAVEACRTCPSQLVCATRAT